MDGGTLRSSFPSCFDTRSGLMDIFLSIRVLSHLTSLSCCLTFQFDPNQNCICVPPLDYSPHQKVGLWSNNKILLNHGSICVCVRCENLCLTLRPNTESKSMREEEIKFSIEIWSNNIIKCQLEITHKKKQTPYFQKGSAEQWHLQTKKLRQQCIKVCNTIRKSGVSTNLKDKFPIYDKLDSSSPFKKVESSPG